MLLSVLLVLSACSSIDLPTVEESDARIARLRSDLARAEAPLRSYAQRLTPRKDMKTAIDPEVLNRVLKAVATHRSDDMRIVFPATRPLLEERKQILGFHYTNRLDIDSGAVTLNLRRAELRGVRGGVVRALLELEGTGRIAVSGKYGGVPASASPRIELSLKDSITFRVKTNEKGAISLIPARQTVLLSTTFHVSLLGWEIPWNEKTPLQLDELLQPITMPGILAGEITLPAPAREYSSGRYEFVSVPVVIRRTEAGTANGRIEIQADVEYR
ncbi:MAG: hypothetical protein RBU27_11850 [Bacteroidota bacterium]|jgi:hypothetical protein|nr:hypothetical protein [Bacteroidota bacterium]